MILMLVMLMLPYMYLHDRRELSFSIFKNWTDFLNVKCKFFFGYNLAFLISDSLNEKIQGLADVDFLHNTLGFKDTCI